LERNLEVDMEKIFSADTREITEAVERLNEKGKWIALQHVKDLQTAYSKPTRNGVERGSMGTIIQFKPVSLINPYGPVPATSYEPPLKTAPEPPKEPEAQKAPEKEPIIITVMPGEPMPEGYPDYRPLLQRDGMFLYAWAVWKEENHIKANWLASAGKLRGYSSNYCKEEDLDRVYPYRMGDDRDKPWPRYADSPDYVVFTAPRGITRNMRTVFLAKLRESGVVVDFGVEFSLVKQKEAEEQAVIAEIQNRAIPEPPSLDDMLIALGDELGFIGKMSRRKKRRHNSSLLGR
jgi:hypothetical protein